MTISFAEINAVTLRVCLKPEAERMLRELGVKLPVLWEPTDEELRRLARSYVKAFRDEDRE